MSNVSLIFDSDGEDNDLDRQDLILSELLYYNNFHHFANGVRTILFYFRTFFMTFSSTSFVIFPILDSIARPNERENVFVDRRMGDEC